MNQRVVIFCHGSGDTGYGAQRWVESLVSRVKLQRFTWSFPSANRIPYSLAGGALSSVWYDRVAGFEPTHPEQTQTVLASVSQLQAVIEEHVAAGVPPSHIAIGGFSMGGGIALQTAARVQVGAVFSLSSYLAEKSPAYELAAHLPPVFMAHGVNDDFIRPEWGQATAQRLQASGVDVDFRLYDHIAHEMNTLELEDLLAFLDAHLVAHADKKNRQPRTC